MNITWVLCRTYEEARNYTGIIYLHCWGDKPFYWGKAHNSFFGGNPRKKDGRQVSARYNPGYRHWIEGCLRHGARLYVGELDVKALAEIDDVENFLISTYGHELNKKVDRKPRTLQINHLGDVPACIGGPTAKTHATQPRSPTASLDRSLT